MKKIGTSVPINKLASRVVRPGTHFTVTQKPHEGFFAAGNQPPIKAWRESTGQDLTGRKFGRLAVVGYSAVKHGRWVVRCSCGNYEHRRSKSVVNPSNRQDMCHECRATFYVTHGHQFTVST